MKYIRTAIATVAAGTVAATLGFASASVLDVNGETIQYGKSGVSCDTNGVNANWGLETQPSNVSTVRFDDIDASCAGAEMFVSVDGAAPVKVTLPSPIPANGVSFNIVDQLPETIDEVEVWIEG